jgi:hypothetical protein
MKILRKNRKNCIFPFANISLITALGGLLLLLHTEKVAFYAFFGVFGAAFSNFGLFFCALLSPQGKGTPFPLASRCAPAQRAARS